MMLIILHEHPYVAAYKLRHITPPKFYFKQLIELAQLVCSAGISNVYKKVPQGKELQGWILKHPAWVTRYMESLLADCLGSPIKMSPLTFRKLNQILKDLERYSELSKDKDLITMSHMCASTAIWRYKVTYLNHEYPSNTELPIEEAKNLYYDYITKFKFPRKKTDMYS